MCLIQWMKCIIAKSNADGLAQLGTVWGLMPSSLIFMYAYYGQMEICMYL